MGQVECQSAGARILGGGSRGVGDFPVTSVAPMFSSGSLSSISLAPVTPSFVMVGDPNFLSSTTLRPLGPSVTLTVSASWLTP